jgi:chromosome segregation ATPase
MTTKHNFVPVKLINNNNDLQLIYNSFLTEIRQLANKKENLEKQKRIKVYLEELLIRNEELKKIHKKIPYKKIPYKKIPYKKIRREEKRKQEDSEYEKELAKVAEDVRQYNAKKEEINMKKTKIKARILELEEELKKYSKEIGLDDLRNEYNEYNELEKDLVAPKKTYFDLHNK